MSELVGQGSKYTDEDRRRAVVEYFVIGNMAKVSTSTGIPESTLCEWKKTDWWDAVTGEVRSEKGEEFDANLTKLMDSAFEQTQDRVDNGDYRVNKEGEPFRVPMGGRDLAIVGATVYDKQRLHRNQPTSIQSDSRSIAEISAYFRHISAEHKIQQANAIEGECEEIE